MNMYQAARVTQAANNDIYGVIFWLLIGILCALAVIILIREIVTWYWKINRIVNLLEDLNQKSQLIHNELVALHDGQMPIQADRVDTTSLHEKMNKKESIEENAITRIESVETTQHQSIQELFRLNEFSWRRVLLIVAITKMVFLTLLYCYMYVL